MKNISKAILGLILGASWCLPPDLQMIYYTVQNNENIANYMES